MKRVFLLICLGVLAHGVSYAQNTSETEGRAMVMELSLDQAIQIALSKGEFRYRLYFCISFEWYFVRQS